MPADNIRYEKVRKDRAYEAVVSQLQSLIVTEKLRPGDRLLPERDLAARFGVSRTAVRDAILVLEERGLVEVRPGAGTFVVLDVSDAVRESIGLLLEVEKSSFEHIHEVRRIFEIEMATLAAERATLDDIQTLERAYAAMDQSPPNSRLYVEADQEFHLTLAKATHNDIFLTLLAPIIEKLQEFRYVLAAHVPESPRRAQEYHRMLLDSVRSRNRSGARDSMKQHMRQIEQDIAPVLRDDLP